MIFDTIDHLPEYKNVGQNLHKFVEYLQTHNVVDYAPGVYTVDEDVFFTVKCYQPRLPEVAGWESHKEYIDIQYVLEGRELMGVAPVAQLEVKDPYDSDKDKISYMPTDQESVLKLGPGSFVLLLPQDAHHPTIIDGEITQNKKIVVKIHV